MKKSAPEAGYRTAKPFAVLILAVCLSVLAWPQEIPPDRTPPEDDAEFEDSLFFDDEDGITITGTVRTSQDMAVVSREEIERSGAGDLAGILRDVLGLNVVSYGPRGSQTGISLRGFDERRVAFLINGIPASSPVDGRFDIFQIDPASIERIEVIFGGSDSGYNVSGALGGVINIVTIGNRKPGLTLGASLSNTSAMPGLYRGRDGRTRGPHFEDLLDSQNASLSLGYGGTGFSAGANTFFNRAGNRFLAPDGLGYVRRNDNSETLDMGASLSLVLELPDSTKLVSASSFFGSDRNIPTARFSRFFGNRRDISFRQSLMLEMPRIFHDDLAAELSVSLDMGKTDFLSPAAVLSSHDRRGFSLINRWNWYPGENLVVRSGLDYRFSFLDSTEMGLRDRHDGGVYIASELRLGNRFLIVPSLKAVVSSGGKTRIVPIPKLGLLWNIGDDLTLKNNYFRGFKFPDFEELYWTGGGGTGNPDLLPQDGWGGDLGLEWKADDRRGGRFSTENTFFAHLTDNSVHWFSADSGTWRPENVGRAVFLGLNSRARFEIPVPLGPIRKIVPSLSYQYLLTYLLAYGHTFSSGIRVPYSPEHTLSVSLEVPWNSGSLVLSGNFESRRFHDVSNLVELSPYFLLNAAYDQKIGGNLVLFASLRNILNRNYESFYNFPMPGISATVGVRVNFGAE